MLTQQHHLVADAYESTQWYRNIWTCYVGDLEVGTKKKFFFLNFQGSQDNWLLESPLSTHTNVLQLLCLEAHQLGGGGGRRWGELEHTIKNWTQVTFSSGLRKGCGISPSARCQQECGPRELSFVTGPGHWPSWSCQFCEGGGES